MHLNIKPSELGVYFIVSQMLITLSGTGLFDWRMFKFLSFLGNIFICCRPSSSAGGERESEEDESPSSGVVYKIGIYLPVHVFNP